MLASQAGSQSFGTYRSSEVVQGARSACALTFDDVQIGHGDEDVGMTKKILNRSNVGSGFEQMGREGVTKGVGDAFLVMPAAWRAALREKPPVLAESQKLSFWSRNDATKRRSGFLGIFSETLRRCAVARGFLSSEKGAGRNADAQTNY